MLILKNVEKTFYKGTVNEKKALRVINLTLEKGDFVTVIGGNGAGKSTMLNMIAGVYPMEHGSIILDGEDLSRRPEHARAKFLGRVFQDPMKGTAAGMEIQENLALAYRRGLRRGLRWGITKKEKERYHEELKKAGFGIGRSYDYKSRTFIRRSETGADTSDGIFKTAGTSAAG